MPEIYKPRTVEDNFKVAESDSEDEGEEIK